MYGVEAGGLGFWKPVSNAAPLAAGARCAATANRDLSDEDDAARFIRPLGVSRLDYRRRSD